ncbi:hypothetical protein PF002_g17018 [Phytophthora fragariae]|uniref:Helitron helicase-like domain-containing protein n=2 Tax=Phytophthora fragariae TaxID=53985 RepID=A0A6A3YFE9_9STRA|nr:hypothetical protein PF002_g17018 [Phytophthora fragariae]
MTRNGGVYEGPFYQSLRGTQCVIKIAYIRRIQEQSDLSENDGKCRRTTASDKQSVVNKRPPRNGKHDKRANGFDTKTGDLISPCTRLKKNKQPVVSIKRWFEILRMKMKTRPRGNENVFAVALCAGVTPLQTRRISVYPCSAAPTSSTDATDYLELQCALIAKRGNGLGVEERLLFESNGSAFRDVNQDETIAGQHGVYTYRIQGAMGHYLGSLLPRIDRFTNEPVPPKFAQIYIVDPEMQQRAERRRGIFADLESGTLLDIEQMMAEHNPFAQQFLNYAEKLRADRAEGKDVVDLVYRLHEKKSNPRTHNLPMVSEVGATLIEDGNLDTPRDILLWDKDYRLLRLFETNPMCDPLLYPLLLPHGELDWTSTDTYANNIERRSKREMSLREHVAY